MTGQDTGRQAASEPHRAAQEASAAQKVQEKTPPPLDGGCDFPEITSSPPDPDHSAPASPPDLTITDIPRWVWRPYTIEQYLGDI